MGSFAISHDFDIDVAGYWKIFLSDEFSKEMFADLKMRSYQILKKEDDGKRFVRVQKLDPTSPIPGFLTKILKSTEYTEYDDLVWETNTMKVDIKPSMLSDRFDMKGDYTVSPLDGGKRCRRDFKGNVKVSIPLIGGRIETYMIDEMKRNYDLAAATTRRWIEKAKQNG